MKGHEAGKVPHPPKPGESEDPGEEVGPDAGVGKPPLVLLGKEGEGLLHRLGEKPRSLPHHPAPLGVGVNLGVLEGAGGGAVLEEEALHLLEALEETQAEGPHPFREVLPRLGLDHPGTPFPPHQAHHGPRHPEADLHLGTDRDEVHVLP